MTEELIERARLAFVEAWEGVNDNWPASERPKGARSRAGIEAALVVLRESTNRYEDQIEQARDELRGFVDAVHEANRDESATAVGDRAFRNRVRTLIREFREKGSIASTLSCGQAAEGFYIIPNSNNPDRDSLWDGIIHPTAEAAQSSLDSGVVEWGQDSENYHVVALIAVRDL